MGLFKSAQSIEVSKIGDTLHPLFHARPCGLRPCLRGQVRDGRAGMFVGKVASLLLRPYGSRLLHQATTTA
jgi:hypothetical protein